MQGEIMGDDHDGGLAADMALLTRRRAVAVLGLAGVAGLGTWLLGGTAGEATVTATGPNGVCVADPSETAGPYPGDGTNVREGQTVNALTQSGIVRNDMRRSFGDMTGVADGVPLKLVIDLVDVGNACAPLAGHAIYVWHADAMGHYSLYSQPDQNYLRAVVVTDEAGRAELTTIVPGCYDGRWPHIHFEVFAGLDAAVSGKAALLTSQFALPAETAAAIYAADARYPDSTANLGRVSLSTDNVFGDNSAEQITVQTLQMTGDPMAGYEGRVTAGIKV